MKFFLPLLPRVKPVVFCHSHNSHTEQLVTTTLRTTAVSVNASVMPVCHPSCLCAIPDLLSSKKKQNKCIPSSQYFVFFPLNLTIFLWTSFFLLAFFFSSFPAVFLSTVHRTGSSPPSEEQNNNPFPMASIQSQNERCLFYKLPMQSWLMFNLWSALSSCFFPAALLPSIFFILYLCT